jgi:hypothetical protein
MTFRPTPIQRPRIPIWVVGAWPNERSMRRALRWDGIVTQVAHPDEVRSIADYVLRERPEERRGEPFEIVAQGSTPADRAAAASVVGPWAEAGATWWIDADWDTPSLESLRRRIAAGPPELLTR